jgi:hypothetical protein
MRRVFSGLIASALIVALLLAFAPNSLAQSISNFSAIRVLTLYVTGNATVSGDATISDDLTVTDDVSADVVTAADLVSTDDTTVGDDLTVTGDAIYTPPARVSLGATQTLVLATANVPISSTASAGVLPTCAAGKIYYVHNVGAQSIIITDSGTSKINGTYTMGNSDSITLLGVGSNCVELARANN